MTLIDIYEKIASHDKKPSIETLKHKEGPIKHEGKKHPKETGVSEHKGTRIPREVESLADRIREKEDVSDEYAYRTAWKIYEKRTSEGKHYKPLHGKHHGEKPLAEPSAGGHPIEKKGFVEGFEKEAARLPTASFMVSKARQTGKEVGKRIASHLKKYRKDYLLGGSAVGALGTAYGANRKKD